MKCDTAKCQFPGVESVKFTASLPRMEKIEYERVFCAACLEPLKEKERHKQVQIIGRKKLKVDLGASSV